MNIKKINDLHVLLALRQTNALSGTPRIFKRLTQYLYNEVREISIVAEKFQPDFKKQKKINCLKALRWPKNNLFQRKWYSWQTDWYRKIISPDVVIGHGDTLHQDILFMHTCVHKGLDLNPTSVNASKNVSVPFHKLIFEKGTFKILICNSKMMLNDFKKRFDINTPAHVIYPGIDFDFSAKVEEDKVSELKKLITKNQDRLILALITSGNFDNRGAHALIRAVGNLSEKDKSKVSILLVGKESNIQKYYQLADQYYIRDQLLWLSPREDVWNLIAAADIIVHPARIEAFGMSMLESMSIGLPIICTETVGCHELLEGRQKEFVIKSQDDAKLTYLLHVLINNSNLRKELGQTNRSIATRYSWEKYDQAFFSILQTHSDILRIKI